MTPMTGDPMLITDYRGEAMRCADTANVTAGPEAMYALGRGLLMAGLSIDDRLAQIAEALTPPTTPAADGTTDPGSGRETGAQRFKVGDGVQVRNFGPSTVLDAGADCYCEVRHAYDGRLVATAPVSWLEPLPPVEPDEPTPAGVTVPPDASPTDSRFDAAGWQYGVRYHDGSVTAEWNGTTQRQHAVDLARLFPDAVVVRRRLNAEWQPAPADLTEGELAGAQIELDKARQERGDHWYRRTVEEFIARRDEYVRVLKQCVEADSDYWRWQGHAEARRQLAESLKTGRPADEPSPGPVVLPTTPGSVAWARDGNICALTDDDDDIDTPWLGVAGDRTAWCFSADELLALGVVRVFDADTGQVRTFDAGTVA